MTVPKTHLFSDIRRSVSATHSLVWPKFGQKTNDLCFEWPVAAVLGWPHFLQLYSLRCWYTVVAPCSSFLFSLHAVVSRTWAINTSVDTGSTCKKPVSSAGRLTASDAEREIRQCWFWCRYRLGSCSWHQDTPDRVGLGRHHWRC